MRWRVEALACGLPLLLLDALSGQEEGNAEFIVEHGAGDQANDSISVLEAVYHWLADDGALLAERAGNARRLGHPNPAYEIADLAWTAQGSLPSNTRDIESDRSQLEGLLDRYTYLGSSGPDIACQGSVTPNAITTLATNVRANFNQGHHSTPQPLCYNNRRDSALPLVVERIGAIQFCCG